MSYCLNPVCKTPHNPDTAIFCQGCRSQLLLKERYRSQRSIGQGGFGRTFLAVDEYVPSKPACVIKQFCPPDGGLQHGGKAAELFQQEAMRLDELGKHPQIAGLLAYFEQDGQQYLIQEFIPGQNLDRELAEKGAFNEKQIWQVLNELLPVLQFCHERQVIHRDIKPENIIRRSVSPETESSTPIETLSNELVLVDFGAAKLATGNALQRTGTVIGSAGYTAPEQLLGKAVFASDLYSLGVTCIHLLTGVPPFDLFDVSESAWIWRDRLSSPVSHALGCVLDRLLISGTRQRYASAIAVLQDTNFRSMGAGMVGLGLPPVAPRYATQGPVARSHPPARSQQPISSTWKCLYTIDAHRDQVRSISFSPNGQFLASGSYDFTVKIHDFHTGELIYTLPNHLDAVMSVAFRPDGKMLASGSFDTTIALWDVETGALMHSLNRHKSRVWAVSFSPDSQTLASCGSDGTVKLWQCQTGQFLGTVAKHASMVQSVSFSPDGQTLASCGYDRTIKLWDLETGKLLRVFSGSAGPVRTLAFSPDGQTLASGGYDRLIRIWDVATAAPIRTLSGHSREVWAIAFSPAGQCMASSSYDKTVKLWESGSSKQICTLALHTDAVWTVAFNPLNLDTGQLLASGSSDGTIKIWQESV